MAEAARRWGADIVRDVEEAAEAAISLLYRRSADAYAASASAAVGVARSLVA
ncbi:MAG: hypothetical protein H5T75_03080 [Coriobacteriia bacterium]|nr:hypothetical protein [Coriobacteriia bacterium]